MGEVCTTTRPLANLSDAVPAAPPFQRSARFAVVVITDTTNSRTRHAQKHAEIGLTRWVGEAAGGLWLQRRKPPPPPLKGRQRWVGAAPPPSPPPRPPAPPAGRLRAAAQAEPAAPRRARGGTFLPPVRRRLCPPGGARSQGLRGPSARGVRGLGAQNAQCVGGAGGACALYLGRGVNDGGARGGWADLRAWADGGRGEGGGRRGWRARLRAGLSVLAADAGAAGGAGHVELEALAVLLHAPRVLALAPCAAPSGRRRGGQQRIPSSRPPRPAAETGRGAGCAVEFGGGGGGGGGGGRSLRP